MEEVDVVGLGGQELWVGLRREYAAAIEVEVDGVLGWCGGDVERVRAGVPCDGHGGLEELHPDAASAMCAADVEVGELHLIAGPPNASALEDTDADQRLRLEDSEEGSATVEAVQQHGGHLLHRIRSPARDVEVLGRANELSLAQLVDVVMHFGAIDSPDELDLVARQ